MTASSKEVELVAMLERANTLLNELKKELPRSEHICAAGHLRTALSIERTLLAEYQERGGLLTGAVTAAKEDPAG